MNVYISIGIFGLGLVSLLVSCEQTECEVGMYRCSDDQNAIQSCDQGQWVDDHSCAEGTMCMMQMQVQSLASSGHDHGNESRDGTYTCVNHNAHSDHEADHESDHEADHESDHESDHDSMSENE